MCTITCEDVQHSHLQTKVEVKLMRAHDILAAYCNTTLTRTVYRCLAYLRRAWLTYSLCPIPTINIAQCWVLARGMLNFFLENVPV